MELRRLRRLHALALDPIPHPADLDHPVEREAVGRVREVRRVQLEPPSELRVAGDVARPQERLELPRLRVPLPVLEEAGHRARERTAPSLRPEVGVGLPAGVVDVAHHALAGGRRAREVVGALALVDEQEVEVARDVELLGAELAHADDGERQVGLRGGDGLLHHPVGDGGDRLPGLARRELAAGRARHGLHQLRLRVDGRRAEEAAGEREDPVGLGHEDVGGEGARRGEVGESPRGERVGGERVGGRDPVPDGLGDPLEPDERGVGVGREREGRRHHREHVREHLAEPRGGGRRGAARDSYARGGWANPSPARSSSVASRSWPGRGLDRTGERLEERPVEQALVDPADEIRGPVVLGLERVGAGEPERPRQRGARVPVGREVVGLQVAHHLQPVLQPAQEPVGVGEGLGVLLRDVALVGERRERGERVGLAEPLVPAAVHDLQELDGELDVADAPAAALDLGELLAATPDVLLEPDLRAADLVDRGLVEVARVDELAHALDERGGEGQVARGGARLDHRLALPGGGLALVVREGGVRACG